MKTITSVLAASTVAAGAFVALAPAASAAYAVNPASTAFTGSGLTNQSFKFGPAGPTVICSTSTFTGTTSSMSPSLAFVPFFAGTGTNGSCPAGALGNVKVTGTPLNAWNVTLTGGSSPTYTATVSIFNTMTFKPLTVPTCTITITQYPTNQARAGLSGVNVTPVGVRLYGAVANIAYTATSGCPGVPPGSRTDAVYDTQGTSASGGIAIPGISFSGP